MNFHAFFALIFALIFYHIFDAKWSQNGARKCRTVPPFPTLFRRGSFLGPLGSFWLPFGSLWAPFGSLLTPFASLSVTFSLILAPFGSLLLPSGVHFLAFDASWPHFGSASYKFTENEDFRSIPSFRGPGADTCRRQFVNRCVFIIYVRVFQTFKHVLNKHVAKHNNMNAKHMYAILINNM